MGWERLTTSCVTRSLRLSRARTVNGCFGNALRSVSAGCDLGGGWYQSELSDPPRYARGCHLHLRERTRATHSRFPLAGAAAWFDQRPPLCNSETRIEANGFVNVAAGQYGIVFSAIPHEPSGLGHTTRRSMKWPRTTPLTTPLYWRRISFQICTSLIQTRRDKLLKLYRYRFLDRFRPFRHLGSAPWHYILAELGARVAAVPAG